MPKPFRSDPKVPAAIPDRLGYAPRIQIPTNFNIYGTQVPPIGPNGDNAVPAKPGGAKMPPSSSPVAPSKPASGFQRKHGLG